MTLETRICSDMAERLFTRYMRWHAARGRNIFVITNAEGESTTVSALVHLNPYNTRKTARIITTGGANVMHVCGIPRSRGYGGVRRTLEDKTAPNQARHGFSWDSIISVRPATEKEVVTLLNETADAYVTVPPRRKRLAIPA